MAESTAYRTGPSFIHHLALHDHGRVTHQRRAHQRRRFGLSRSDHRVSGWTAVRFGNRTLFAYPTRQQGYRQLSAALGSIAEPSGAVSWHRLIFPDTSSLDLPDVPTTDAQGYAALTGEVNSHYGATFGAALLTSILSIAPTLAFNNSAQVPPFTGGVYHDQVNEQVASQAMIATGAQMGATANQFLMPRLSRPKTIKLAPGSTFDIFVTKDLSLPGPYQDHAGQLINAVQR